MEDIFESLKQSMATKTDEELAVYLNNTEKHDVLDISSTVAELRKRGKFDESKFEGILEIIRNKLANTRPTYYSRDAIFIFSCLSVLCGAILFSLNLKSWKDKWVAIGFGITYTVFIIAMRNMFDLHPTFPLLLNSFGGMILEGSIWNRYIDKNAPYKKRSVLMPVLIVVVLLTAFSLYFDQISLFVLMFGNL